MLKKVLLVRLDKIGDLICTLPADQILDSKTYDTTWVIQKGLGQIVQGGEKPRKYIEIDKDNPKKARLDFARYLEKNHFDYAISFQCPWWVNYEIFKAKIKNRIGVLSQWHSFLFLNKGLRQKRSQALQHEFNYNLDLVKKITGPINIDSSNILFKLKKPQSSQTLEKYNLPTQYTVVHPGMMGSALNWPQAKYIEYIQNEISNGHAIAITGTPADEPYLTHIKAAFENHPHVHWLQSKLNFSELVEVLNYAQKVVVPSTGVAHIAASLDKEVHGIYSPIQVHHPKRWAPRGENIHIHMPSVKCPAQFKCLGGKCSYYNCMNSIEIKSFPNSI
ncbi:MAG: glycosyltransferase family 9 protein [Pseudobdellovibrio sp.]